MYGVMADISGMTLAYNNYMYLINSKQRDKYLYIYICYVIIKYHLSRKIVGIPRSYFPYIIVFLSKSITAKRTRFCPEHWCGPCIIPDGPHHSDVIMDTMASQITSIPIVYSLPSIHAQIKENIKAPRHWPSRGDFTGDRLIPRTKSQLRGNVSFWWCHHATLVFRTC